LRPVLLNGLKVILELEACFVEWFKSHTGIGGLFY
jgi:hypothetical protein